MQQPFDHIIIGAGFAGAVMAERLAAELGHSVLVIEKRNHIGGNAYDHHDEAGVLIHRYGPHIFHTNDEEVWRYLSRFTEWFAYEHRVLGVIDGKQVPIPFNFDTLKMLFPPQRAAELEAALVEHFGIGVKVPILRLREVDTPQLKELADFVYAKVFYGYTTKQWGMTPEELNPGVTGRVPVHLSRDDRYFQDRFQGMPLLGYTRLFEKMLAHPRIKVMLNTDYHELLQIDPDQRQVRFMGEPFSGRVIYSGKIDELFDFRHGELPYRSLRFEHQNLAQERFQAVGTINYPNNYDFTRITEFKHLTGQAHPTTSIVTEFPQAYERGVAGKDIPYYPVPQPQNQTLYERYQADLAPFAQVIPLGRLAEYRYYDMHQIVGRALKVFRTEFASA